MTGPTIMIKKRTKWFSVISFLLLSLVMVNQVEAITPENQPNSAALMDKAKKDGWVRVIVILDIPATPEGYLPTQAHVINQRQLIASKQSALLNRIRGNAIRNLKRFKYVPLVSMMVTESGLQALLAATETAKIVEDAMFFPSLVQSIPLIGADDAHVDGFTGQNQTIAILDSGVDGNHPFLTGKIVSEACFSTTTDPTFNLESTCPNGQASQIGPGSGAPCRVGGDCDHGTHVAGIAAGGNSGIPFSGVAKGASLIAIQISSLLNDNAICGPLGLATPCVIFFVSDILLAGEHIFSLRDSFNIAAVNLSLGGQAFTSPCDSQLPAGKITMDLLRSVGIATIVSSGNDGLANSISIPACISSAISVGATDKSDQVPFFSNSASFLDLLAPGVNITSSVPGTEFSSFSGTSMAAPHVAGAFAVLRSKNPSATVDEILAALKNTGQSILDTRNGLVKPRIQVDLALTQILLEANGISPGSWELSADGGFYFVRDKSTNNFPFVIQTGVPSDSLRISPSGNIGLGTSTPTAQLHVKASPGGRTPRMVFENPDAIAGNQRWFFDVKDGNGDFRISRLGSGVQEMNLTPSGDLKINGNFIAGATTLNVPDYVFEPGYPLLPLDELSDFIEREKHLPNVPSAEEIHKNGINMTVFQMKLLEKVEELTLYVVQQEQAIQKQEQAIQKQEQANLIQEQTIRELKERLEGIESAKN